MSDAPVSDDRLLEIAGNMKACVPFELGPLDLADIRNAVLELYRLRQRRTEARFRAGMHGLAEREGRPK